jgi:hypothetical protein
LSRLHPAWFPTNETAQFLPSVRSRLNYPLNYWNGLAALIAVGIPLVILAAHRARTLVMQGLAAAALPAMGLAALYTFSRGGAIEIAVALIVLFALHPRRVSLLPTTVLGAGGTAILIVAATQRDALEAGLTNSSISTGEGGGSGFVNAVERAVGRGFRWWHGRGAADHPRDWTGRGAVHRPATAWDRQ